MSKFLFQSGVRVYANVRHCYKPIALNLIVERGENVRIGLTLRLETSYDDQLDLDRPR
jgi:hypothetical protein